ncbi:probable G-protein coupled receptor No18 [Rhopalosiphum maidis]|uniref:probable G-protein coupled receptor No18 n=1 Tax=Rhopalosiphum maidis TaxID=43146 RepID=UPI000EFEFC26|nr:probable G-protein coupled receptor No18 [Rhopalosiphum maidis]
MESLDVAENLSSLSGMVFKIDQNEYGLLVDQNGTGYLNDTNVTMDPNRTYYIFESVYPSTYSIPEIVIASVVVIMLMIVVVVGNMLVIIAIVTEKALKNVQNWFIASLAVADFFLGIIVMPFSLANELMGYWIFGDWWCDIHAALDVLLCTASIMNLCLIALDRYWSITQAVDYLKKRTPARAMVMIGFVWIFSGVICIPPLLGWKVKRVPERYPKCELSEDLGYRIYSALGSFYIPSCIMVFVYIRIYFAAKARARRGIRKPPSKPKKGAAKAAKAAAAAAAAAQSPSTVSQTTSFITRPSPASVPLTAFRSPPATPVNTTLPVIACDYASDASTSDVSKDGDKDTLKVFTTQGSRRLTVNGDLGGGRCRASSVAVDTDMVSELEPSSSDSGNVQKCGAVKPVKSRLCKPIFGVGRKSAKAASAKAKRDILDTGKVSMACRSGGGDGHHQYGSGASNAAHGGAAADPAPCQPRPKPRDPEREKRRIARKKEKRATLILGLIMGSFIACWLPFFFMYILKPLCPVCYIPPQAFAIAFWLGYMNSAINPVIYTIFNKDFRRSFRRVLFK